MTSGSVLVGWHPPRLVLLWIQINGVDMTEARHDQAVALLTGTSPTIALLVERDLNAPGGSPGQTRARAHSPPPPEPSDSPDQDEEGLGNHLSRMEDEYPIEVRIRGLTCVSNSFGFCLVILVAIAVETSLKHSVLMLVYVAPPYPYCCPVPEKMVYGMKAWVVSSCQ